MIEQEPIPEKKPMNEKELAMLKIKQLVFRANKWAKLKGLMRPVEDKKDEPMEVNSLVLPPEAVSPDANIKKEKTFNEIADEMAATRMAALNNPKNWDKSN